MGIVALLDGEHAGEQVLAGVAAPLLEQLAEVAAQPRDSRVCGSAVGLGHVQRERPREVDGSGIDRGMSTNSRTTIPGSGNARSDTASKWPRSSAGRSSDST